MVSACAVSRHTIDKELKFKCWLDLFLGLSTISENYSKIDQLWLVRVWLVCVCGVCVCAVSACGMYV